MQQSYAQGILRAWQQQQVPPEPPAALIQVNTVLSLIYAGLFLLYDTVLLRAAAATVGCLATGIRVVDAAGGRAPAGRLLWRSVLKYLGFVFNARPETVLAGYLFTVVNFLWPLRGGKRLALHDQWSSTRVVRA